MAILTGAAGALGMTIWQSLQGVGAKVVPVDLHGDGRLIADVATSDGNRRMLALGLALTCPRSAAGANVPRD